MAAYDTIDHQLEHDPTTGTLAQLFTHLVAKRPHNEETSRFLAENIPLLCGSALFNRLIEYWTAPPPDFQSVDSREKRSNTEMEQQSGDAPSPLTTSP
jgi:hypothetical protein